MREGKIGASDISERCKDNIFFNRKAIVLFFIIIRMSKKELVQIFRTKILFEQFKKYIFTRNFEIEIKVR